MHLGPREGRRRPAWHLVTLGACLAAWAAASEAGEGVAARQPRPQATVARPLPTLQLSDALLRSAFAAVERSDFAYAERLLSTVLAGTREGDAWTRGEALRCRALIAIVGGRYAEAAAGLTEAGTLFESAGAPVQLALTWRHRAFVAVQSGDRPLARELAGRALAVFEGSHDDEEIVNTLSTLLTALERDEGGVEVMMRALELAERTGQRRQRARLLHSHGDWRFGEGDFAGAARSYEQAEAGYRELDDEEGLGRVWTSLGRLNRAHGRHSAALDYYRRAYTALQRAGDQQGVIQAVNAIATALDNLGRPDEARLEFERALALAERIGAPRIVNFQRGNLGGHYVGQGDFARAVPLLQESARQESSPTTRAIRLTQLGRALAGEGRPQDALAPLDEAIEQFRRLESRERLFNAFATRADTYRALGRRDEALADVRASLEVLEEVRRQLAPGDFLRRGFHQQTREYASLGIRTLVEAGRARDALEVAEQARARAFLDLLAARPALAGSQAEAPLLLTRDRATPAAGTPVVSPPQVAHESMRAASLDEVIGEARARRSTILNYWVDATRSHVWVVDPQGRVRHATIEVTDRELVDLVRALWAGLPQPPHPATQTALNALGPTRSPAAESATGGGDAPGTGRPPLTPRGAARELYRLLIAPVEPYLPAAGALLTIVPHGPLFRLSFAALLDASDRYLVERYALAYGPSVSVLAFTRGMVARQPERTDRYLFVGDPAPLPAMPGDTAAVALPPLPGTLQETRRIAALVPSSASTMLTGTRATERAVSHALGEASVIHLATHGIVRDDDPFGSFLALGADGVDAPADGALTAEEIYGLRLNARLVVLSACRSGLGEVTADGIVGLTRAFFFAGAPSVVASLWDVADGPSVHLLRDFYLERARGVDTARALRAAQLGMLRDLRAGRVRTEGDSGARLPERPVLWASFVLVGEP